MTICKPEFEWIHEQESSFRYLEHSADSELIRWHFHHEYELHLLIATRGKAFVGDYVGTFSPGCLVLTGPNVPHNWISRSDLGPGIRDMVINFSDDMIHDLMRIAPGACAMTKMLADSLYGIQFTRNMADIARPLFDEIAQSKGLHQFSVFLDLMDRLAQSAEYTTLSTCRYDDSIDQQTADRVDKVVSYITTHFTNPITLDEVAQQLHLSPVVFSRFFHKATGHKFKDFVNRLRIARACEALENTDQSIVNICFDAGFTNLSNFNRRFMDIKGMTPTDYRRNIAQRDKRAVSHILL